MIIDSHTHVHSLPGHPWDSPPERILRLLDDAGIAAAAIMPYSDASPGSTVLLDQTAEWAKTADGRLIPYARLAPDEGAAELLRNAVEGRGFMGLKLHPVGFRAFPDDPGVIELLEMAGRLGIPALFHCGDEEYTLPLQILRAAEKCPQTRIILGHMGGYFHVEDAIFAAKRCENIILETSAMPFPSAIKAAVEEIGPERVIFGSDGPGCLPALEVDKTLLAGLDSDQLCLILSDSYLNILRRDHGDKVRKNLTLPKGCDAANPFATPSHIGLPPLHDHRVHLHCSERLSPNNPVYCGGSGSPFRSQIPEPGASIESIGAAMSASGRVASCTLIPGYCPEGYFRANERLLAAVSVSPVVFKPLPRINPNNGSEVEAALDMLKSGKTKGIFLHPQEESVRVNSELVKSIFRNTADEGGYLMIAGGYPLVSEAEGVAELAESCPNGVLVATSAAQIDICGMHLAHARAAMQRTSNLVAETSGIYRQDFIEDLIRDFGPDRVVFGSGFPRFDMAFETRRISRLNGLTTGTLRFADRLARQPDK